MSEFITVGWKNIAKLTPYGEQTLRKRFGPEMIEKGYVIKSRLGPRGRVYCWAYPEMVKKYFMLLGMEKGVL